MYEIKKRKTNYIKILIPALIILFLAGIFLFTRINRENKKTHETLENKETLSQITQLQETEESTQNQETETQYEEPVQQIQSVNIKMVGDVLLHTPVSDSGKMDDGTYNYDHLFANVKSDIESAYIAIANQEVILGGRDLGLSGYPAFNGAFEVGDSLVNSGFDVILHATNHALDKGKQGIINCINYWRTNHPEISFLGINDSSEMQDSICVKEVNGIKIAILNYTYGTNGISMPSDMPYAVNLLDKEKIARDIELAKTQSDFIVVCPHWGIEYTNEFNREQEEMEIHTITV